METLLSQLLPMPSGRSARWDTLKRFIAAWYRPLARADGFARAAIREAETRLESRLPAAFLEWYELAGDAQDIWCRQDYVLNPTELRFERNPGSGAQLLVFMVENQAVTQWSVEMNGDEDPPVYVKSIDSGEVPWLKVADSFSIFALTLAIYCVKFYSDDVFFWATGYVEWEVGPEDLVLPKISLPAYVWPIPTHYWGTNDLLVEATSEKKQTWFYVLARTNPAFLQAQKAVDCIGISWESWGPNSKPVNFPGRAS